MVLLFLTTKNHERKSVSSRGIFGQTISNFGACLLSVERRRIRTLLLRGSPTGDSGSTDIDLKIISVR